MPAARVAHQRCVERAADGQRQCFAHAERLGVFDRRGEAVRRTGDHNLAGRVVVGDPHGIGRGGARAVRLFERRADERSHASRMGVGRGLGQLGAMAREARAVVDRHRPRRDQRGHLTE